MISGTPHINCGPPFIIESCEEKSLSALLQDASLTKEEAKKQWQIILSNVQEEDELALGDLEGDDVIVQENSFAAFLEVVQETNRLSELNFSAIQLSDEAWQHFIDVFPQLLSVSILVLSRLPHARLQQLSTLDLSRLNSLDLSCKNDEDDCLEAICAVVLRATNLQFLSLAERELTNSDLERLIEVFPWNTLNSLDLSLNAFSDYISKGLVEKIT